jgi:hypothetical protein
LEPGVPISRLAELRASNPGRGPHSIIGPIAVRTPNPAYCRDPLQALAPCHLGFGVQQPGRIGHRAAAAGFCAGANQIPRSRPDGGAGQVCARHQPAPS